MRQRWHLPLLILLFVASPLPALAKDADAGFPPQSIWVSNTFPQTGDEIQVSTVVRNGGDTKLSGTVVFLVDEKRIGTKAFELDAGESELVSMGWKSAEGTHTMSASIEDASWKGGDTASIANTASGNISITVSPPPTPPALENAVNSATNVIHTVADQATPMVQNAIQAAYDRTEEFRNDSIAKLEKYLAESTGGSVLGASTTNDTPLMNTPEKKTGSFIENIKHTAAVGALSFLKSSALFYPVLLIALFGLLYLAFRWALRRP